MRERPDPNTVKMRRLRYEKDLSALKRTIVLDSLVLEDLAAAASRRGITAMELANRILEVVTDDNLIDGILDDIDEHHVSIASTPDMRHAGGRA